MEVVRAKLQVAGILFHLGVSQLRVIVQDTINAQIV
jgi:hypothetical protein